MYSNSRRSTFPGAKGNPGCLRSRACTPVTCHHSLPSWTKAFSVQIADVSDFGVISPRRVSTNSVSGGVSGPPF